MTSHRRQTFTWILIAASLVWLAVPAPVSAADSELEVNARKLEGKLMAPCCMANTVGEHYSPPAAAMRREIREMLAAGKSEKEILAHYVAKHGDLILSAPAPQGFNLVAYVLPFLLLIAGIGASALVLLRWARRPKPEAPVAEATAVEPEYAERLQRALHEFDSAN